MTKATRGGVELKMHKSLVASADGPVAVQAGKPPVKVLLTQGDLDGACGQYCVWMALIALGLASRDWLTEENGKGADRAQGMAWKLGAKGFFSGIGYIGVKRMLKPYKSRVVREVSNLKGNRLVSYLLDKLNQNALCLVGVKTDDRKLDHWVLAVGIAGERRDGQFHAKELLLLDPSYGPVPGRQWNATLSVIESGTKVMNRKLQTPDGKTTLVKVDQAVAVALKESVKGAQQ